MACILPNILILEMALLNSSLVTLSTGCHGTPTCSTDHPNQQNPLGAVGNNPHQPQLFRPSHHTNRQVPPLSEPPHTAATQYCMSLNPDGTQISD